MKQTAPAGTAAVLHASSVEPGGQSKHAERLGALTLGAKRMKKLNYFTHEKQKQKRKKKWHASHPSGQPPVDCTFDHLLVSSDMKIN